MSIPFVYRCKCMVEEVALQARERRKNEDVVEWINEAVSPVLFRDHKRRSPNCLSTATDYCKIEYPENAEGVGFRPHLDS